MAVFGCIADENAVRRLTDMKNQFGNAELINNSFETAPSKRISKTISTYSKTLHGTRLASIIGVEKMKSECAHFSQWIERL